MDEQQFASTSLITPHATAEQKGLSIYTMCIFICLFVSCFIWIAQTLSHEVTQVGLQLSLLH